MKIVKTIIAVLAVIILVLLAAIASAVMFILTLPINIVRITVACINKNRRFISTWLWLRFTKWLIIKVIAISVLIFLIARSGKSNANRN